MILLSLGNLGDLLIQAAFLRRLNRAGVSVAVPSSYASIAAELFPEAAVIPLTDRWSDGRWLMSARLDRTATVTYLLGELGARYPGRPIKSLSLTDELIHERALNIYAAYWRLLQQDPVLADAVAPTAYPSAPSYWVPFDHLPRWSGTAGPRTVYLCPWGGFGLKTIPADDVQRLYDASRRLGCSVRLLVSPRDDANQYRYFRAEEIVRLSADRIVHDAATHLSRATLVVAVDTAWYHLAAMIGAPVMGVPGPRSLGHFEFPGAKRARSPSERRLCADCFSVDRCVVTNDTRCDARPDAPTLVAALEANLSGSSFVPPQRPPARAVPPAPFQRAAWRLAFHGISAMRTVASQPALRGPSRRLLRLFVPR